MDFGGVVGLLFSLGFFFFFFALFNRLNKAFKANAKRLERDFQKAQRRQAEASHTGTAQPPMTLQQFLVQLEASTSATPARTALQLPTSEVEKQTSETELDHSLEKDLPSYESLIPLGAQTESHTSVEAQLPHYERSEGILTVDYHAAYGAQDDMSHVHVAPSAKDVLLSADAPSAHQRRKPVHPLRTHLMNPTNFRMAFLATLVLQRPNEDRE